MNREETQAMLQKIAQDELPLNIDLWPTIRQRIQPPKKTAARRRLPKTRLGWAVTVIMALLITGTAVYALVPALQQVLVNDPGLGVAYMEKYGNQVNLTQTIDNVTVNLQWVYADADRIAVGYTMTIKSSIPYNNMDPLQETLTSTDGTPYRMFGGFGSAIQYNADHSEGTNTFVTSFRQDKNNPVTPQTKLHYSLIVEAIDPTIIAAPETMQPASIEAYGPHVGPFTFEFSTAPTPERVTAPNQTAVDQGITFTLKKVMITPSAVRADICFAGLDPAYDTWQFLASIDVGNVHFDPYKAPAGPETTSPLGSGCYENTFMIGFYDYTGPWTLTVTDLVGIKTNLNDGSPEKFKRLTGHWVFTFDVK